MSVIPTDFDPQELAKSLMGSGDNAVASEAPSDVDELLDRMHGGELSQESTGNYNVKPNPRTGAVGGFQVLPENVGPWTAKHYGKRLTPQEFQANPDAQEAVFRGEMGSYLKKARAVAPDDDTALRMGAAAWYGGPGAMHRYDDPTKFRPNEPSFREYTQGVLSKSKPGFDPHVLAQGLMNQSTSDFDPQDLATQLMGTPQTSAATPAIQSTAQATPPVPEVPETLDAQRQAANDPQSTRAAVLYTPGEQVPTADASEVDIPLHDGSTLRANVNKLHDYLENNQNVSIADIIAGRADFTPLIGGKAQPTNNTANTTAVVTRDPQGRELVSSAVATPDAIPQEAAMQQAQFPNHPTTTEVTTADDVNAGRLFPNPVNVDQKLLDQHYSDWLAQKNVPDSNEARQQFVAETQQHMTDFAKQQQNAPAAATVQHQPPVSGTQEPASAQPAQPVFDAKEFNKANAYLRSQGQPEITKEQYLAAQAGQPDVQTSIDPHTFKVDGTPVTSDDLTVGETTPGGGQLLRPAGLDKPHANTSDDVAAVYQTKPGQSEEDAFRDANLSAAAKYGTSIDVEGIIHKLTAAGKPLFIGGYKPGGQIAITENDLVNLGADPSVFNQRRAQTRAEASQSDLSAPQSVKQLPTFSEFLEQAAGERDGQNQLTDTEKKKRAYLDYSGAYDKEIAEGIKQTLLQTPDVPGTGVSPYLATTGKAGIGSFVSDIMQFGGGLVDYTTPVLIGNYITGRDMGAALGQLGNRVEKINDASTPDTAVYRLAALPGDVVGKFPGYAIATAAAGGNPVLGFVLHDAVVAKGKTGSDLKALGGGAQGFLMGASLGPLKTLGEMAANGLLGEGITSAVKGVSDPTQTAFRTLIEKGTPIGLATGLGYGQSAAQGGDTKENLKNALLMGAMEFSGTMLHKAPGETLTPEDVKKIDGTVIRVPDDEGKPVTIALSDKDGELQVTKVDAPPVNGIVLPERMNRAERRATADVPATDAEPETQYSSALDEIRQRGLDTKAKIQQAFPQLSREEAADLRRQAFEQNSATGDGDQKASSSAMAAETNQGIAPGVTPEPASQIKEASPKDASIQGSTPATATDTEQVTPTLDPAHDAATSPHNDLPQPTEAQLEAGNYQKGHININGLDISVEHPAGSERTGTNAKGEQWSRTMDGQHYGYIKRTVGADDEHIDTFIKDGTPADYDGPVFVVDQARKDGSFDEHKVMLGFDNEQAAREAYARNYPADWKGAKDVTPMSMDDFKVWAKGGPATEPAAETFRDRPFEQGGKSAGENAENNAEHRPPAVKSRYVIEPPRTKAVRDRDPSLDNVYSEASAKERAGGELETAKRQKQAAFKDLQRAKQVLKDSNMRANKGALRLDILNKETIYKDALRREQSARDVIAAKKSDTIPSDGRPERTVQSTETRRELPEPRQPAGKVIEGSETHVTIPDGPKLAGRYAVRELEDVVPSHNPVTFQPNPDYHYVNDRHYDKEPQYQEQVRGRARPENFDPSQVVNNNPTSETGPPIIDSDGNVLGGNSRAMMLHRVYEGDDARARDNYRKQIESQASVYGIDPKEIQGMKRPVLVRELHDSSVEPQQAITELNKTSTTPLTVAERSIAESRRMSDDALDYISGRIEAAGGDATLNDALNESGPQIVNKLIEDGVLSGGDRNALIADGKITPDGKARIERILNGQVFDDLDQLKFAPPYVKRNIERAIAPLVKSQGDPEWNLIPETREAIDLLTEWKAKGPRQTLEEYSQTPSMMHGDWSRAAITLAETLNKGPVAVGKAFKTYAGEFANAKLGGGLFGALSQKEAFDTAFERTGEVKPAEAEPAISTRAQPDGYKKAFELPSIADAEVLKKRVSLQFETPTGRKYRKEMTVAERQKDIERQSSVLGKLLDCIHG